MKINDIIHGFRVTRTAPAPTSDSELIEMEHENTGARLVWLKNNGENKLFSIAFRTPPKDHTGIFHILEHSVLGGSKKYPVKEPFLELMKGSMNTFLNAMTYPDKTIFPVSSRNDTDFMNLTRVYLDAVFDPSIYYDPNIFYQEGWHIEMRKSSDTPVYKGVVFNEMKGAMSSVYNRIETELMSLLFPNTCYQYESGGLPEHIPDLTYEQFIDGHKTYYHPSNSYIFLDGPVDIEAVLGLIDGEYLCRFQRREVDTDIQFQKVLGDVMKCSFYEIAPNENEKNRTYFALGRILGSWQERERIIAASVLAEALTGSNDAPLKRAIMDKGLCLDVSLDVSDGILQPFGCLVISNTDLESCTILKDTALSTAKELCSKGIDRELLRAAIDRLEFQFRAGGEPRGLTRNTAALSAWLYGGDPLYYLELGEVYDSLRSKVDSGYFEALLRDWLLSDEGEAMLYLNPSHTYGENQRAEEKERLDLIRKNLDQSELDALIAENKSLDKWQRSVDTPEKLATMPHLALSEVSEAPLPFTTHETLCSGVTVLRHPASDKGIAAVDLHFSLADCSETELSAAAALSELFGSLPTSKSSAAQLQRRITGLLGSISYSINVFSRQGEPEKCTPYLSVKARFLEKNTPQALDLIAEIITDTVFTDTSAITELLKQTEEDYKQSIISNGHSYAMTRARASLSAESAVTELVSGYEGCKRLHIALKAPQRLIREIVDVSKRIICSSRLTASLTDSGDISIQPLIEALPVGAAPAQASMSFILDTPQRQGIIIPSGVSYTGMAFPDNSADIAVLRVLFNALSLEYLWNEIRVKGGAYGTGAVISPSCEQSFYSYRDPSPAASLDIFRRAADFMADYCDGSPDITQYIISSIAREEPLLSDGNKSARADGLWFRGISYEERAAVKKRMLSVTPQQLREAAEKLRSFGNICVIGNEAAIKGLDLAIETLS